MVPEVGGGDTRTPFEIVARYDGIWRPIHFIHENKLILVFETLSAH